MVIYSGQPVFHWETGISLLGQDLSSLVQLFGTRQFFVVEAPVHFRIFKIIPGLWPLDASSNSSVEITKNNILCKSKSPWAENHCFENKDREISLWIQEKKYKKVWGQKTTEYKNISKRERQYVTRKLILKSTKCNWYTSKSKQKRTF